MADDASKRQTISPEKMEARKTRKRITQLFNELAGYQSEELANAPEAENNIRTSFRNFLQNSGYHFALKNFDMLLEEKSGKNSFRNDGTVNWYHELVPILMVLKLGKMGKHHGGFDLEDLEKFGGLEVAIVTHFRHDSVEDHVGKEKEQASGIKISHEEKMKLFAKQLYIMRDEIIEKETGVSLKSYNEQTIESADISKRSKAHIKKLIEKYDTQIEQVLINTDHMTQKKSLVDGRMEKEDVKKYTGRMSYGENSNPIVFLLKQADVIHNFATMLGAGKFPPERRLKRCNEREDMYGRRQGFVRKAKNRWPEFKSAIRTLDHTMGFLLFPNLRYLETMDQKYFVEKGIPYKEPNPYEVGAGDYAKEAFSMNASTKPGHPAGLPEGLNPTHIFLKRMANSADPLEDPEKYELLQKFMDEVIRPSLEGFEDKAPYLFEGAVNDNISTPKSAIA